MNLIGSKHLEVLKMGIKTDSPSLQIFYRIHPKDPKTRRYQIFLNKLINLSDVDKICSIITKEH